MLALATHGIVLHLPTFAPTLYGCPPLVIASIVTTAHLASPLHLPNAFSSLLCSFQSLGVRMQTLTNNAMYECLISPARRAKSNILQILYYLIKHLHQS